ncbi:MAG: hypothetical protein QXO02_07310 [Thermofilaceae archaeon]
MRVRTLLLALLFALIPLAACAEPGFELVDSYWVTGPAANVTSVLGVVVRYAGASSSVNLSASLRIVGVRGQNLESSASYTGYLPQGSTINLDFNFTLPEGPYASYYPATLTLTADGTAQVLHFQVGFGGRPSFRVSASPETLRKGESNQVLLSIELSDTPARNVEVRVTPASAFVTVIGGSLRRQGLVEVGERLQVPLTVQVDSTAGDSVALTVTVSYEDFSRAPGTLTTTVGFQVVRGKGSPSLSCYLSPSRVPSGSRVNVALIVSNAGATAARDVRVSVTSLSPGVALLSGASAYLGDLASGESKVVGLTLRADRTAVGVAQLQVSISYYDEYGDARVSTVSVGFEVTRSPQPLLSAELLNSSLPYGVNAFLAAKIVNIGGARALDVLIDAVPGGGLYVLSQTRFRAESVEPGKAVIVPLLVRVEAVTDSVTATFRLRYYDDYGYEYNDLLQVSLNVTRRRPLLSLEALNRTLHPNRVNRVLLKVVNIGSAKAVNISVALASQSSEIGAVIGPSTLRLDTLKPGDSALLPFEVFIQPRIYGALQLLAAVTYGGDNGMQCRDLYTLGFEVRGDWELSAATVVTKPSVVFPGDSLVQVIVTLVNSGDYMARDVEVKFVGNEWVKPVSAGAAEAFIPYLPVGQTLTLTFLASVDERAPIGNHRLAVEASGRLLYFTFTVLEKASLTVRNASSLNVVRGSGGYKLVYEVENPSNSTAEDVRVEVFSPFITGTTSVYLGTLWAGERKLAIFEVNVDPATPLGQLPLDVKVSWVQQQRSLSQYSRSYIIVEKPAELSTLIAATAALLALALLAYYKRSTITGLVKAAVGARGKVSLLALG